MHIKLNDLFLQMQHQLDTRQAVLDHNLLIELVNRIRPADTKNPEEIHQTFKAFYTALLLTPDAASTLQSFVLKLIGNILLAMHKSAIENLLIMLAQFLSLIIIASFSFFSKGTLWLVAFVYSISPVIVYLCAYPFVFWFV